MERESLEVPEQLIHRQQTQLTSTQNPDCWTPEPFFHFSQAQSQQPPHLKGPRRTRHRVDAGEPRGCFNSQLSTAPSQFFPPRNVFLSPPGRSSPYFGQFAPPELYFQPMTKMLSEFISSPPPNGHVPPSPQQLLLREMLSKKSVGKCGYEEEAVHSTGETPLVLDKPVLARNGDSASATSNGSNSSSMRINGCKKRKLYQPVQRQEVFEDDLEEEEFEGGSPGKSPPRARPGEEEEEEEIRMMIEKEDFDEQFDDDDSDRTNNATPTNAAPLTRMLLAERPEKPVSLLRTTSSPKAKGVELGVAPLPPYFAQWKENFKSTLLSHINELVDSQLSLLYGPVLRDSNRPPLRTPTEVRVKPPLLHNGGGIEQNNNREQNNNGPPAEKILKLDPRKEFFHRFPFHGHPGNVGNAPALPNHVRDAKHAQNFSSALIGLSAAREIQERAREDAFEDGPLSLVVQRGLETPRKKRHKVTDTRLTPRAVSRLLGQDPYDQSQNSPSPSREQRSPPPAPPQQLSTSVAVPNPSLEPPRFLGGYNPFLHHHRLDSPPGSLLHPAMLANPADYVHQLRAEINRDQEIRNGGNNGQGTLPGSAGSDSGETNSFGDIQGSLYSCGNSHSSSTLTPMHLRKAKLMFFWVRYPSSSVIKMYFPDIKFNKNNTAQLVKWFSNFREFYYIQMEKYARQALSEGVKNGEELHVTVDNELYRVLNLHYNRNNHIEVPSNFRYVVEQTLREFFKAIQQGKDQEQSWKKAIYKIIARLDDPVPDYFKSPNFLEQLE